VLVWILGTVTVLGTCIHWLHGYQVRQNAGTLSEQARRALCQGQSAKAATYWERYLTLVPGDTAALAEYGLVLAKLASGSGDRAQALLVLEQVLRREPGRRDVRRRVIGLAIDQYQFHTALTHLDRLLADAPDSDKGELEHLLGWCQDAEGNYEAAAVALRRAVQHAPARISSYVLLAEVLMDRLVQPEEAAKVMNALVAANPRSPQAWLARARFLATTGDRNGAARDLAEVRRLDPADTEVTLAAADLARAGGHAEEARALVELGLKRHPKNGKLYEALADIELGDHKGPLGSQALARLVRVTETLSGQDQACLLRKLAEAHCRRGELEAAQSIWQRLALQWPRDLQTRFVLLEVARAQGQDAVARSVLQDIRQMEGEAGMGWRWGEAMRLLRLAERGDPQHLAAARKLVGELAALQPEHPKVALLQGGIDDLERHYERAIGHYQQTVERGEHQGPLLYRLTQLLVERRRFTQASQVVRQAEGYGLLSTDLARLGADAALGNRDPGRAVQLARKAVPATARDYRDALWLARLLEIAGKPAEAEKILRATLPKAPHVSDVWAALVGMLARDRRREEAEAILGNAARALPADQAAAGLARCYEALGDLCRAETQYRDALKVRPDDRVLLRAAAEFFRRTDQPHQAEPFLRRLLDPATQAPADARVRARRQLAILLAGSGKEADYREALALIQRNVETGGASADGERARAVVLASRPGQQLAAVRLFEASFKDLPISEEDQFLLAQLAGAAGLCQRAQELMLDVLANSPDNPQYLSFHICSLLGRGDLAGARLYLDKLERIEPRSTRTLRIKALLGVKDGA
jgi:tetratricopeptide (TPR) repeat protein